MKSVRLIAVSGVMLSIGCSQMNAARRFDESVKNAFIMYSEHQEDLAPPSPRRVQSVDSLIGRDAFLDDLSHYVTTKYKLEAIYVIGWLGDKRHVSIIGKTLNDPDPAVQRVALVAFNNLTHKTFESIDEARGWWSASPESRSQ